MPRFFLKFKPLCYVLATLLPALGQAQSVIQLEGVDLAPGTLPAIIGSQGISVQHGVLAVQCPAPAIRSFTARRLDGGLIRIEAEIANIGGVPYRSQDGQQLVTLTTAAGAAIGYRGFVNLAPGESFVFATERSWNPTSEFQEGFGVAISYEPDILRDANPQNDDCRLNDNRASLTPPEINALFN